MLNWRGVDSVSIGNRREREKEDMKELILSAANDIVVKEGYDKLSIRKIANSIEYSPSLIYHYFKDKDQIINVLMERGYQKIVMAVSSAKRENISPEAWLEGMMRRYIDVALSMPDEFMAAHLNRSPEAVKQTSSLFEGATGKKIALTKLHQCIRELNEGKVMDERSLELTTQLITVSTIGLIIKLIIEEDIGEEQRKKLKEYFVSEIVLRMAKSGSEQTKGGKG